MKKISLEEYKIFLINYYVYECDNNEKKLFKRKELLEKNYSNEYLENIIFHTYKFIDTLFKLSDNNYHGYIKIKLECEPYINDIFLNLTGGGVSDTIVNDSYGNFYSINLLKLIFENNFYIEPCHIDIIEKIEESDYFTIMSEIPSYYFYFQCKKEVFDDVKRKIYSNKKILNKYKNN